MQNFSYIVEDESTHEAIVIDPSWDLEKIISIIEEQNLIPKYIVNTHWHDDHTHLFGLKSLLLIANKLLLMLYDLYYLQELSSLDLM